MDCLGSYEGREEEVRFGVELSISHTFQPSVPRLVLIGVLQLQLQLHVIASPPPDSRLIHSGLHGIFRALASATNYRVPTWTKIKYAVKITCFKSP